MYRGLDWLEKEIHLLREADEMGGEVHQEIIRKIRQMEISGESESLTQEWIDENKISGTEITHQGYEVAELSGHPEEEYFINVDWLEDVRIGGIKKNQIIDTKPEIPLFVADFVEEYKQYPLLEVLDEEWLYDKKDPIAKWLYDNSTEENEKREMELVIALRHGYKVKEEPKYYVEDNYGEPLLAFKGENVLPVSKILKGYRISVLQGLRYGLTEQEIKDYDERFWAFAKPVERDIKKE